MKDKIYELEKWKLLEALKRQAKFTPDGKLIACIKFDSLVADAKLTFDRKLRKQQLLELHSERKIKILSIASSQATGIGDVLSPEPVLLVELGRWHWEQIQRGFPDEERQARILTHSTIQTKVIEWYDEKPWKGGQTKISQKWEAFEKGIQEARQEALDAFYKYQP